MRSSVLEVMIDERLHLERMTENAVVWAFSRHSEPLNTARRVFKDYVLSCDVYRVDNQL